MKALGFNSLKLQCFQAIGFKYQLAPLQLDDDGLPHTLEHLIFLGSKNFPYKGILDMVANRCFASGGEGSLSPMSFNTRQVSTRH